MSEVVLIEDHDEALKVWRKKKIKDLDLVHIDAHIDFGFYPAKSIEQVVRSARNLKELKKGLEYSLAFMRYEKDFDKQTNIGNYIYPAIQESIVKNLYWVVPGGLKEFKESGKFIKGIVKSLISRERQKAEVKKENGGGIISTKFLRRKFVICILKKLPVLKQRILLDIDTDFLIIDNLLNANNTKDIGKRKPWIYFKELVEILKAKIKQPELITIAYSVNGGYTPIEYKHLGDEMAYYFAPARFKSRLKNNSEAARYFNLFTSTGEREYYQKAAKLNPTYRVADNNYGPLYSNLRKFSKAKKEFLRILSVDPKNPACLFGLGNITLERKKFKEAKEYFSSALNSANHRLFAKVKSQSLFGLAKAEFGLRNFTRAKEVSIKYKTLKPLDPQSYYLLGCIFEKEKKYPQAATFYQDAIRLGFGNIEPMFRLLKISSRLKEKDAIIKYVIARYKEFKRNFLRAKKSNLKVGKKIKGLQNIENKMAGLEKRLHKIGYRLSPTTGY